MGQRPRPAKVVVAVLRIPGDTRLRRSQPPKPGPGVLSALSWRALLDVADGWTSADLRWLGQGLSKSGGGYCRWDSAPDGDEESVDWRAVNGRASSTAGISLSIAFFRDTIN